MNIVDKLSELSENSKKWSKKDAEGAEIRITTSKKNKFETDRTLSDYEMILGFPITEHIKEKAPHVSGDYVLLDLGAGSGRALPGAERVKGTEGNVVAFGITRDLCEDYHPREKMIFGDFAHDGHSVPNVLRMIPNNSVDMVMSCCALKHTQEIYYTSVLNDVHRVLKPGGVSVLHVYSKHSFYLAVVAARENGISIGYQRTDSNGGPLSIRIDK